MCLRYPTKRLKRGVGRIIAPNYYIPSTDDYSTKKMKKVYPIKLESQTISDLKEIAESVGSNPNKVAREFIESGIDNFKKTGKI